MRKFNKALSVLLAVLMLCVMIPFGAMVSAADTVFSHNFEDGQKGFNSDCNLQVVQDNGSNVLHWNAGGADWANVWAGVNVEANVDYQVSFKLKANMASSLSIKFLAADWMSTVSQDSATAATEWSEYDVTLNGGAGGSVIFMIQTGLSASAGQQIYLDDVVVAKKGDSTEPEQPETPDPVPGTTGLVQNGDFETGNNTGWKLYQNTKVEAAAAKTGNYGLHIVGNGGWGGLGNQTITGLQVGKVYRISLWYKALSNGVNIQLCEGTSDQGAKIAYVYGSNNNWTEFAVEFEATTTTVFFTLVGAGNNQATEMYMDDVSLTEVVLGGDDNDPNLKMIDTLMVDVKTQGRTAMVRGTLMLDFTASGMEFELDCQGDVYATFNASKIANSASNGGVYFTIVVDGVRKARDYCRIASVGETKVKLAEGLSAGKHTFAIYRQSEHSFGEVGVCALSFDGEMLDKPAAKDLYIEYIGDSITCGYGNIGNSGDALNSDGTQAYAYVSAQALNADWSIVSWSGLGCKYGYSSTTMQDVYPAQRYNYDQTTPYNFAKQPDIVVLALGTNDNSIQSDAALKREGLKEMLTLVRQKNPTAPIVWIHGMMTSGVSTMIEEIVAEFGGADAGYYACRLTQNNAGGGSHPSLAGQQKFADELVAFIQANGLTKGTDTPDVPVEPDEPEVPADVADLISNQGASRTEDDKGRGLAFRFKIVAEGITVKKTNTTDLSNAYVKVADGTQYKLVAMGAVVTNNAGKGLRDLSLVDVDNKKTLKINAKYLCDLEPDSAQFAVRITNIPAEQEGRIIYARSYFVYEDADGNQVTVYGDVVSANYINKYDMNDGVLEW